MAGVDDNETSKISKYKRALCRFMSFKDGLPAGQVYPSTIEFSVDQLLSIKPIEIARWMRKMAYGTPDPGPDDHPTYLRSGSLENYKKAISFFMPNKNSPWILSPGGAGAGNPTRSADVLGVIDQIKLAEVRKRGRESRTKRDMKRAEYRKTLELLRYPCVGTNNFDLASHITAMMKLQFHIIGRTDDICHIETEDLRSHSKFPDIALQMKVSWSKNVRDERHCPDQLLLGAEDSDFCVLTALACYLESSLTAGKQKDFLFAEGSQVQVRNQDGSQRTVEKGPTRLNAKYCRVLRNIWMKNPEMIALLQQTRGSLGTHSLRKFPSTWCSEHGCSEDEVEIRGRWKGKKRGRTVH